MITAFGVCYLFHFPHSPPNSIPRTSSRSPCHHRIRHPTASSSYIPPKVRPDALAPASLPQTIEYAIRQAQYATAQALIENVTHLRIELPMGRSRKHWYAMSPLSSWYTETAILVFHYAELFRGLSIHIVLAEETGMLHHVPWIHTIYRLNDPHLLQSLTKPPESDDKRVVILAAFKPQHSHLLNQLCSVPAQAIILFNSFLTNPLSIAVTPFIDTYIVRALNKSAVMLGAHQASWNVFVEIAVFHYEWVGDCASNEWRPSQKLVNKFAAQREARQKLIKGYWKTEFAGCEAGFWPFMTISCRQVAPLDGRILAKKKKDKNEKKKRIPRPFGFF